MVWLTPSAKSFTPVIKGESGVLASRILKATSVRSKVGLFLVQKSF